MSNQNLSKDDFNRKSKEICRLLNEYRKNPKMLAKHLEGLKKYIDPFTNVLNEPNKMQIQMVEGEAVFNEAIAFINRLSYLDPLILDENLCKSAMEHVLDIGPKGLLSYQSSDGSEPEERISKYGNYVETLGENIDFGPNDAIGVIISLTLDDGETDRPHRENLFKSEFKKIGIACGTHKTEFQMCVMDFASDFVPVETENIFEDSQPAKINLNFNENAQSYYKVANNPATANANMFKNTPNTIKTNIASNTSSKNTGNIGNSVLNQPSSQLSAGPVANTSTNSLDKESNIVAGLVNKVIEVENINGQVSNMQENKKIASKYVEVTTKVIYHYYDGTCKEVSDTKSQTFLNPAK